jgi:hypothetical protein
MNQYWLERTVRMKDKALTVAGHLVTYDAYLAGFIDSHNASLGVFGLDRETEEDKKQFDGIAR